MQLKKHQNRGGEFWVEIASCQQPPPPSPSLGVTFGDPELHFQSKQTHLRNERSGTGAKRHEKHWRLGEAASRGWSDGDEKAKQEELSLSLSLSTKRPERHAGLHASMWRDEVEA